MKPVYKIEVYDPTPTLRHTITDQAITLYYKDILTGGVGHFTFSVPAVIGDSKVFDDITVNDIVKIYGPAYDSVPATPTFMGRVCKVNDTATKQTWVRTFSGLSNSEILLRMVKRDKLYDGTTANAIVTEWAQNMVIYHADDIDADATPVYLTVKTKTFFDLLRWISDYWKDAETQVKKDFWVDVDGHLHWKARPLRSGASVESLTAGDNIINYSVDHLVDSVKNNIMVYGGNENHYPLNQDEYTEQTAAETPANDGWTVSNGAPAIAWDATSVIGNESVMGSTSTLTIHMINSLPDVTSLDCVSWRKSSYKALHFYIYLNSTVTTISQIGANVNVRAPDASNFWGAYIQGFGQNKIGAMDVWAEIDLPFIWDADVTCDPIWGIKTGSPAWDNVQGVDFYCNFSGGGNSKMRIDGFHFRNAPFWSTAGDAASQTAYGQRDLEVTDPKLLSDSDCSKRAQSLLYQLKDAPKQLTVEVKGNANILKGDRISMTLPEDNIVGVNFDVVAVEQNFRGQRWTTKATMVDSVNVRSELILTPARKLAKLHEAVKALNISELEVH